MAEPERTDAEEAGAGAAVEVRAALLRLRRSSGLPVAFGGLLTDRMRLRIGELSGAATHSLRGLAVATGNGLGGKSLALSQPVTVTDYRASRTISHEYDSAVAAEGLRAVLAVPVIVGRRVRGVLYGALREPMSLGDRTLHAAMDAARELEQALAVRDEAQRLLAVRRTAAECGAGPEAGPGAGAAWEEVRAAHAELRALAPRVADPELRGRLLTVCERLAGAGGAHDTRTRDRRSAPADIRLARRELDVLACVAAGATNAGAAERLGVRPETVKAYLRSAMRRMGAHTRLEAVVTARRAGLLP